MFKCFLANCAFRSTVSLGCLLAGWVLATPPSAHANSRFQTNGVNLYQETSPTPHTLHPTALITADAPAPKQIASRFPDDPLNSPFPIPWPWILETQEEFSDQGTTGQRYYRSQALVSPDGQYAAYTRISLMATPALHESKVTSVMFLENLQTGKLQVIKANSPVAKHLSNLEQVEETPGIMSILMPVSWSANGDRLLSRQLEGFFSTSDVTDYGVIWERNTNQTTTVTPTPNPQAHETAILLGWNNPHGDQVLFRSGMLGAENWPTVAVTPQGEIQLAHGEQSVTYGQLVTHSWTGSQSLP